MAMKQRPSGGSKTSKTTASCLIISVILISWLCLSVVWFAWCLHLLSSPTTKKTPINSAAKPATPILLSTSKYTTVTTDVRGNLGPPRVLLDANGTDWIKDRWQAASDMHGTAIRGEHWVQLEFSNAAVRPTRMILDWETSYAEDYRVVGSCCQTAAKAKSTEFVYYDSHRDNAASMRTTESSGQSPGVKQKLPLHVIDTIQLESSQELVDRLVIEIRKPFHRGWGVSLWSVQVIGYREED